MVPKGHPHSLAPDHLPSCSTPGTVGQGLPASQTAPCFLSTSPVQPVRKLRAQGLAWGHLQGQGRVALFYLRQECSWYYRADWSWETREAGHRFGELSSYQVMKTLMHRVKETDNPVGWGGPLRALKNMRIV